LVLEGSLTKKEGGDKTLMKGAGISERLETGEDLRELVLNPLCRKREVRGEGRSLLSL